MAVDELPVTAVKPLNIDSADDPDGQYSDIGSFMCCSDDEIDVQDECEPVLRYTQEIYYPISIGEVLNSRYRVVHKLGWGGFSTVWMARDLRRHKMVALKIGIPPGEEGPDWEEREFEMQQEIARSVRDRSHILTLLDAFHLTGPKGLHTVNVFPPRGPSLKYEVEDVPMKERMKAAKQLLLAIKALHDADIIVRDLNNGGILWDIGDIENYTAKQVYQAFGRPRKVRLQMDPWKEGELVARIKLDPSSVRGNISLADFGLAIKHGTQVKRNWQSPAIYCGPERFHRVGPSFAGDMWSYGCLLGWLYLDYSPIHGHGAMTVIDNMVKRLGPLPAEWAGTLEWADELNELENMDSWYDQQWKPDEDDTLEAFAESVHPDLDEDERALALGVLRKVLVHRPEQRLTASGLLEDADFKSLMSIYEC